MVRALVGVHFDEQGRDRGSIYEPHVPVFILFDAGPEIQIRSNVVNDLVLRVKNVDR